MKKIFVIGPNKCGSSSIHHFFESNGITSAHWGGGDAESNLAYRMKLNCEKGLPVLNGMEEVTAFSDFNYFGSDRYIIGGTDLFENLYAEYPDAYYILNTRPTEKWLLSRLRHSDIAERTMKLLNLDLVELIKFWIDEKENHEIHMAKFFQNKSNYLVFDLESSTGEELAAFLAENFIIHNRSMPKLNVTLGR